LLLVSNTAVAVMPWSLPHQAIKALNAADPVRLMPEALEDVGGRWLGRSRVSAIRCGLHNRCRVLGWVMCLSWPGVLDFPAGDLAAGLVADPVYGVAWRMNSRF
jgi:hypothetical protein